MSLRGVVSRKGASVTFSWVVPGNYDAATDITTGSTTSTLSGKAMEIDGDPDMYKDLGLIESDNPTLLFTPDVVGQMPPMGASVTWGGDAYAVKGRKKLAMNGTATAARIVVGR